MPLTRREAIDRRCLRRSECDVAPVVHHGEVPDELLVEAISEAVIRKTMRFVPVKSVEQQAAAIVLKTRGLESSASRPWWTKSEAWLRRAQDRC